MKNKNDKKRMNTDAEQFIECTFDDFTQTFELSLHWWVSYRVRLEKYKLEALHRVISKALKQHVEYNYEPGANYRPSVRSGKIQRKHP